MRMFWLLAQEAESEPVNGLSVAGATIMTLSVAMVLGLCAFCFWRILREPTPSEHHHTPLDIDTRDLNG